jgi:amino acid permease
MEAATQPTPPEPERYSALRTVSTILRIFAWIIAIVGTLFVIGAAIAAGTDDDGGVGQAFGVLIAGLLGVALYALFAFAGAELIRLMIAIETNTRRTAELLER